MLQVRTDLQALSLSTASSKIWDGIYNSIVGALGNALHVHFTALAELVEPDIAWGFDGKLLVARYEKGWGQGVLYSNKECYDETIQRLVAQEG